MAIVSAGGTPSAASIAVSAAPLDTSGRKDLQVDGLRLDVVHREPRRAGPSAASAEMRSAGPITRILCGSAARSGVERRHDVVVEPVVDGVGVEQRVAPLRVDAIHGGTGAAARRLTSDQREGRDRRVAREATLVQRPAGLEVEDLTSVVEDRPGNPRRARAPRARRNATCARSRHRRGATRLGGGDRRPHARRDPVHARADRAVQVDDHQPIRHAASRRLAHEIR